MGRCRVSGFAEELKLESGTWQQENSDSFGIGIVVEGELEINGTGLCSGDNFFLPYAVKKLTVKGSGRMMLIRPPRS